MLLPWAVHLAFSWLGGGGDHSERIVPSRMGFMCFAEEKTYHPGWSCKVIELVDMNMMVAVAQSPGQGESPSESSPHMGFDLGRRLLFSLSCWWVGEGCSNCTLLSLQVHSLLCSYEQLYIWSCLPLLEKVYPLTCSLLNTVARPC